MAAIVFAAEAPFVIPFLSFARPFGMIFERRPPYIKGLFYMTISFVSPLLLVGHLYDSRIAPVMAAFFTYSVSIIYFGLQVVRDRLKKN